MDALRELVELEALRRLKARYFLYLDLKRWDEWLELFAPDATMKWDAAPSLGDREARTSRIYVGVEAIRKGVVDAILVGARTVHHGHTPLLELTSETDANGIWAMEDYLDTPDGTRLHAFGHYHEIYRKVDATWRIASLHLTRLRVTVIEA